MLNIFIMKTVLTVAFLIAMTYSASIQLSSTDSFQLHQHAESTGARCLDGSPSALYILKGQQSDKTVMFFEGGGACVGLNLLQAVEDCYRRSKTHLGSSAQYAKTRNFDHLSILSTDPEVNPLFFDWNKAFIPYCDGSLHQGSKLAAVSYLNVKLFFRGSNNTLSHLSYMNETFNLFGNSQIVVSGTSAGGVATFIWGNYIAENSKHPEGVLLVPDSGIFISDFVNPITNIAAPDATKFTFKITNGQTDMPVSDCVKAVSNQRECFSMSTLYKYLKPRTFIIQSLYDLWGLTFIAGQSCIEWSAPASLDNCDNTSRTIIEAYKEKVVQALVNFTSNATANQHGVWGVSCVQHGFLQNSMYLQSDHYQVPATNGSEILEALSLYYNGSSSINIDSVTWPQNSGCNGFKK